jgi:predicted regulator of Ras-like GTPase activity (Roadblock/LC7/MglB family)
MSRFAQLGLRLEEHLLSVVVRWRGIRGLLLVDSEGLPLASTLRSRNLEERLAALATLALGWIDRAQDDLELGSAHVLHLAAQDRQLFLVPVPEGLALAALAEADANPTDIERLLLGTARDLLNLQEVKRQVEEAAVKAPQEI